MSNLKILIVEDDLIAALDLQEELTDLGYQVPKVASDYSEAITAFVEINPDLVLLDINLGNGSKKDGIEIAQKINNTSPKTPLIFLSAYSDKHYRQRAADIGYADYLIKPYNKTQLELTLERVFRNHNNIELTEEKDCYNDFLFIKEEHKYVRVDVNDIVYLKASGSSTFVYSEGKKRVVSTCLSDLLMQFNHAHLIRIHRSFGVNINKITGFMEGVVLVNYLGKEQKITLGKKYKDAFFQLIKRIT